MNSTVPMYQTTSMRQSLAGCVSALLGIGCGLVWWDDLNWAWFWVAFGLLALSALLCWIGYRHAVSAADYALSVAGLGISVLGLIVLVVAGLAVLTDEDDSDNTTPRYRRRYGSRGRSRYRQRPPRRRRRRR